MNILYLDCAMGAAGDMLMAALLELLPDKGTFLRDMNALGLPGIEVTAEPSVKCGVTGTHVHVFVHGEEEGHEHHDHEHEHGHKHHHTGLHEIEHRIGQLPVPEAVREDVRAVYRSIADAESRVHGAPVEQLHFHEVGTLDALADVVGVCWLMHRLAPDAVYASPVHVGSGQVKCAHGILPVPAPATALLLEGIPCYGGAVRGERHGRLRRHRQRPEGRRQRDQVLRRPDAPAERPRRAGRGIRQARHLRRIRSDLKHPADIVRGVLVFRRSVCYNGRKINARGIDHGSGSISDLDGWAYSSA